MKKLLSALAALALGLTAIAPAAAARDHGYYGHGHHGGGYGRGYYRRHDDHGDAVAAGIVGLAVGALIGSAASQPRYDNRYYAPPPPAPPPPYYRDGYYGGNGYYGGGGYYDQRTCFVTERQWDPYVGRYLRIQRPVPC